MLTQRFRPPQQRKINMNRIGLMGLVLSGISSMIGSGWLLSAQKAAQVAGPAAILAWPVGMVIMLLLALNYAELGAAYPKSGGMARFAELTHGSLTGFLAGWANWISIITVIPIEAVATVQYLSSLPFAWTHLFYSHLTHTLSPYGIVASWLLILVYFLINYWSVKLFLRVMMSISLVKLSVPLLTILGLFFTSFHLHAITHPVHGFMPHGIQSIFVAVATSGIVFSFHGFQSPINLAAESRNPQRDLPLAIFISMLISFVIYMLLQIVFIGSVPQSLLQAGWSHLQLSSPYIHLAMAVNLNWLILIIYVDSVISPSGTAITYTATSSRVLSGLQKNGYLPYFLGYRHPLYQISRPAMWTNLVISFGMIFFFRSWSSLVDIVSIAIVISYITGPVCVMVLRRYTRQLKMPLQVTWLKIISPISFVLMSYVLYWGKWPLTGEVTFLMLLGFPIYLYYQIRYKGDTWKNMSAGLWLVFYLAFLIVISYLGAKTFGGIGVLSNSFAYLLITISALIAYYCGIKSGWQTRSMRQYVRRKIVHQSYQPSSTKGS